MISVVGIGGGIGASRLWKVLAARPDVQLTCVVNTADDLWIHGLRVCPDLDTVLYALTGRQDVARGWGLSGDTFRCMEALGDLAGSTWFRLGDLDLATHLYRTSRLREGAGLAQITQELGRALGLGGTLVLPATEAEVRTVVTCAGAELGYPEFLVRTGAQPVVDAVRWEGIGRARPAPGVIERISAADLIVLGPSNPLSSISPALGVPEVREAVHDAAAPVVAVTPVVSAVPILDEGERRRALSRERLLASVGLPHRPSAVAGLYADLDPLFVLDTTDLPEEVDELRRAGLRYRAVPTLIGSGADPGPLAAAVLGAASDADPSPDPLPSR